MRKFTDLGLSFVVTNAQARADMTDEEYRMLMLLALNAISARLSDVLENLGGSGGSSTDGAYLTEDGGFYLTEDGGHYLVA